jgi:ribonuclease HI
MVLSSQQKKRIESANAALRQRRAIEKVGNYLRDLCSWGWFDTTTFSHQIDRDSALAQIVSYLRSLESASGEAVGWALAADFGPRGGRFHAHILIAGIGHLSRYTWWKKAFERFGRTEIRKFEDDGGAEYYLAKHAVQTGILHVGGPLLAKHQLSRIGGVMVARSEQRSPDLDRLRTPKIKKEEEPKRNHESASLTIFIDGAGMRPNGTGSGYAWVNSTTGQQLVRRVDGLTNNVAEYRGLLSALRHCQVNSRATVYSDSQLVVSQFGESWAVRDATLSELLEKARNIIRERRLSVTLTWIPRSQNIAGKLL